MVPTILRLWHERGYYLRKELPSTARPYREDLHAEVPDRLSMER